MPLYLPSFLSITFLVQFLINFLSHINHILSTNFGKHNLIFLLTLYCYTVISEWGFIIEYEMKAYKMISSQQTSIPIEIFLFGHCNTSCMFYSLWIDYNSIDHPCNFSWRPLKWAKWKTLGSSSTQPCINFEI